MPGCVPRKTARNDPGPTDVTTNRDRRHNCRLADIGVPIRVELGRHVQGAQGGYRASWIGVGDLVVDAVHLNPPPANAPPSAPGRLDRTADAHPTPPSQTNSVGRSSLLRPHHLPMGAPPSTQSDGLSPTSRACCDQTVTPAASSPEQESSDPTAIVTIVHRPR